MVTIDFIQAIINVSEKAANIARACRQKQELFKLLVQEKCDEEKNKRFLQDFKTLADVLIQETVKYDLGSKFPQLADHIHGEESNAFTNTLGETIFVEILDNPKETADLLCKVLDDDRVAADLLAEEVHKDVQVTNIDLTNVANNKNVELPFDKIGIWIDPIDSTAEYINGEMSSADDIGMFSSGLRCVTVLIGVFLIDTGESILGVINQPFHTLIDSSFWQGKIFWGISYNNICITSIQSKVHNEKEVIALSSSEDDELKNSLAKKYQIKESAGAGYKLLCTALGICDFYVLSRGSTFRWDTCAPHALLKSFGSGGIISYKKLLNTVQLNTETIENDIGIKYTVNTKSDCCNESGIIAYNDVNKLQNLYLTIKNI